MTATLHWNDSNVEVHKLVVGPFDNNVFVIRCRATGDAVLIDAANEHEKLLELCAQLGVRRVLETHGHWDHLQAIPAMREAGSEVAVTAADAPRRNGDPVRPPRPELSETVARLHLRRHVRARHSR